MKLYVQCFLMHLKRAMTYRASFFISSVGLMLLSLNTFLGVVFLLERFETIGGYTLPQLSLCYGAVVMGVSLAECFGRGFDSFAAILSQAQFDRILVRPRSLVFQVLCQDMKPANLSRVLQGVVMLGYGVSTGGIVWTPAKGVTLIAMVLCGSGIFFGLYMLNAALCFFTLEGLEVMNIFTNGPAEYGKYPFGIYGKGILWVLTLLVPLALVQHWPLQYLLDRGPAWYGVLPVLSLLFLLPCTWMWRMGVRHYTSTGS